MKGLLGRAWLPHFALRPARPIRAPVVGARDTQALARPTREGDVDMPRMGGYRKKTTWWVLGALLVVAIIVIVVLFLEGVL